MLAVTWVIRVPTSVCRFSQYFENSARKCRVVPPGFSSRVGRQDIGPMAVHDAVDLQGYLVPMQGAFQTLVPALRLDLAAGVDLG